MLGHLEAAHLQWAHIAEQYLRGSKNELESWLARSRTMFPKKKKTTWNRNNRRSKEHRPINSGRAQTEARSIQFMHSTYNTVRGGGALGFDSPSKWRRVILPWSSAAANERLAVDPRFLAAPTSWILPFRAAARSHTAASPARGSCSHSAACGRGTTHF